MANVARRTDIRHLHAPTAPIKRWVRNEAYLINVWRKCSEEERLQVICYAERLAHARIVNRLERDRQRHRREVRT